MNLFFLFFLFSGVPSHSALSDFAETPVVGGVLAQTAHRILERGEEGTYELRNKGGIVYLATLVRARSGRVILSLADQNIGVRKSFLYVQFDPQTGKYRASDYGEEGQDGLVPSALVSIDDGGTMELDLTFARPETGMLRGKRVDFYDSLRSTASVFLESKVFRGKIGMAGGKQKDGILTLYPSGNLLVARFESSDGRLVKGFTQGDQIGAIHLTSLEGREGSFFHLRLSAQEDGTLRGYSVVAGIGKSAVPCYFEPIPAEVRIVSKGMSKADFLSLREPSFASQKF